MFGERVGGTRGKRRGEGRAGRLGQCGDQLARDGEGPLDRFLRRSCFVCFVRMWTLVGRTDADVTGAKMEYRRFV